MRKMSILTATDPDVAQAAAALERAARNARRLSDQTNTPFYVFIDEKVVDLRKLEQESLADSTAGNSPDECISR